MAQVGTAIMAGRLVSYADPSGIELRPIFGLGPGGLLLISITPGQIGRPSAASSPDRSSA